MSERPLPDDLEDWPDNPYDLLGVAWGVEPRQLRRAYNRLIRVFKPEQFPDEFRRIREAYESLLRYAELWGSLSHAPDLASEEPAETVVQTPQPTHRVRGLEEELAELWDLAVTGQSSGAYHRLVEIQEQSPARVEPYLRLYWLLTLYPELDPRRCPADWLVEGMQATGLAGPLRELYQGELADNPAEALSPRCERLLTVPVPVGLLADLAEWRFKAAVQLGRWDVLAEDRRKLRLRFGPGEEEQWLRLLFALADRVAWTDDALASDLLEACRVEIVRHEYLASNLSQAFDRFELLQAASVGWRKLQRQGFSCCWFLHLLADSWQQRFREVRPQLLDVLKAIAAEPPRWLDYLSEIQEEGPTTLALFGELLKQLESAREPARVLERDAAVLTRLVQDCFGRLQVENYSEARRGLLVFCTEEAVAPEEILTEVQSWLHGPWAETGAAWSRVLSSDWALRYVCWACRLFWS